MISTYRKADVSHIQSGRVVYIGDKAAIGKIKVRIPGFNDNIPIEQLPWATYAGSSFSSGSGGGSISVPKIGAEVQISFKNNDPENMQWSANTQLDPNLSKEIAGDYEGSHVVAYDSDEDLSIMFQRGSGLRLYYKGSSIQITPDNNVTIHYGNAASGTQIQLSEGKIDIQASKTVNLTTSQNVNVESKTVCIDGEEAVQIKGDTPGECAVNGNQLVALLRTLAEIIDMKMPASSAANMAVTSSAQALLNHKIQYI